MKKGRWYLTIGLITAGAALRGQDADETPTRFERLLDNLQQITSVISMDRAVYFPGETATVTVTMTNRTSAPLEIPDPRAPGVAGFALSSQGGAFTKSKSEWTPFEPHDQARFVRAEPDLPSVVMQPGETITLKYGPADKGVVRLWWHGVAMPTRPANYRLRFRLGGQVGFQIGAPVLEASAIVPLQEFKTFRDDGMEEPETLQSAAMVVAVSLGGENMLFAAQHNMITTYRIDTAKDGTLSKGDAISGAPWIRLTTVPAKVTKLTGTADPSGQITLEYTTEDGGGGKIYLDKNRHPL